MIAQRFSAGKGGFMNSEPASAGGTNGLSKEHLCRPRGARIRNSRPPRPEGRGYHLSRPRRSGIGNAGAGRVPHTFALFANVWVIRTSGKNRNRRMYETNYPTQPKEGWVGHPAGAGAGHLHRAEDAARARRGAGGVGQEWIV